MTAPRIGLSSCFDHADPQRKLFTNKTLLYVEQSMIHWVAAGGALVYPIPTPAEAGPGIDAWVDDLDGLVLHGGSDVAPTSYDCAQPDDRWPGDPIRDAYEVDLYRRFRDARKPVLGICRGMQIMNVAHRGTLHQDFGTAGMTDVTHRNAAIYDHNVHEVDIGGGTRLESLVGPGRQTVNSIHHQGVALLGDHLVVEATSSVDDVVEAIRVDEGAFALGVQWHPEFFDQLEPEETDGAPLLDNSPLRAEFLDRARENRDSS